MRHLSLAFHIFRSSTCLKSRLLRSPRFVAPKRLQFVIGAIVFKWRPPVEEAGNKAVTRLIGFEDANVLEAEQLGFKYDGHGKPGLASLQLPLAGAGRSGRWNP